MSKIGRDLGQLLTLSGNISGTDRDRLSTSGKRRYQLPFLPRWTKALVH